MASTLSLPGLGDIKIQIVVLAVQLVLVVFVDRFEKQSWHQLILFKLGTVVWNVVFSKDLHFKSKRHAL